MMKKKRKPLAVGDRVVDAIPLSSLFSQSGGRGQTGTIFRIDYANGEAYVAVDGAVGRAYVRVDENGRLADPTPTRRKPLTPAQKGARTRRRNIALAARNLLLATRRADVKAKIAALEDKIRKTGGGDERRRLEDELAPLRPERRQRRFTGNPRSKPLFDQCLKSSQPWRVY